MLSKGVFLRKKYIFGRTSMRKIKYILIPPQKIVSYSVFKNKTLAHQGMAHKYQHLAFKAEGRKKLYIKLYPNSSNYIHCCFVAKLCATIRNPMDWNLPGSPVHGISQARILEWVAISFSRGSSQSRDQTHLSCTDRQIFYH